MSEPNWVRHLTERFDKVIGSLQAVEEGQGRLMGGIAELRRDVNEMRRQLDRHIDDYHKEKSARLNEDISLRKELHSVERRMNGRNAGAGAAAGALMMVAEWAIRTFGG